MRNETGRNGARHERGRLAWLDGALLTLVVGSVVVVAGSGMIQVSLGTYSMSLGTVRDAILDPAVLFDPHWLLTFLLGEGPMRAVTGFHGELPDLPNETLVVWSIRLPRVVVGVLVGASLAVSGAIFQGVTRNELASPYVLGVSSGAGLAILLTLVVFSGLAPLLPIVAAVGGATAFLVVYAIAWKGGTDAVRLVLAGVVVNMGFQSLQRGLYFFADDLGVVQSALAWTTGSLTGVGWEQVRLALPWAALAVVLAVVGARQLNVLLLGEGTARSLGMPVERVRFGLAGVAVLAASAAISVAGIVSFVGLVVPHIVRNLVGSDYRRLMVGCVFAGPALLTAADVGARLALSPVQLPVGVVTGLVGGPYFLYLMRKRKSVGEL